MAKRKVRSARTSRRAGMRRSSGSRGKRSGVASALAKVGRKIGIKRR